MQGKETLEAGSESEDGSGVDAAYQACLDRVRHANVHIRSLKRAFRAYISDDAYRVETQLEIHDPTKIENVIYATLLKEPPASLGFLVGDAVNDLRSALDNLTWALTVKHSGKPPNPIPSKGALAKWRNVKFPTTLCRTVWPSVYGNNLFGVEPRLRADFEALQPYARRKTHPERDPLAILNELWNWDKHRRPSVVVVPIKIHGVRVGEPSANYTLDIAYKRRLWPLKRRTEIGRMLKVDPPGTRVFGLEVDMDYTVSFGIVFEQGPPAYGQGVYTTLESCRDATLFALRQFEPEFR